MKGLMYSKSGQEKIWDYFQNEGVASFSNSIGRLRYLARFLKPKFRILNIGVGNGAFEHFALEKGCDVYCLDPNQRAIERVRSELKLGDKACVGYSQSLPFNALEFDVVVMSEVLEHLSDEALEKTIDECYRVLKQGGLFIGTVPADEKLSESYVACPNCGNLFHRWGHLQEFSERRLKRLLERQFVDCIVKRKFFSNFESLNWKGKFIYFLKKLAIRLGVKGSGETLFFMARKSS